MWKRGYAEVYNVLQEEKKNNNNNNIISSGGGTAYVAAKEEYIQKEKVLKNQDLSFTNPLVFTYYNKVYAVAAGALLFCISFIFSRIFASISFANSGLSPNNFFTESRPCPSLSPL
jgi:hypothetical protein